MPDSPDLMPLIGARTIRSSEPEEGHRLAEGLIKDLTGGEPIEVRALAEGFVPVDIDFRLRISGRDEPGSQDR